MYAYEIPGLRFSGVAKEDIKRYTFVAPADNGEYTVAAAGKPTVGVAMNDPKAGEVTAGNQVKVGTDGKAAVCADGTGAVGIALVSAKVNEQTTVKLG